MSAATTDHLLETNPWRPAEQSPEVLAALETFDADGYAPRPVARALYYFLPIDELPWPASADPDWYMNDVQEFFVDH